MSHRFGTAKSDSQQYSQQYSTPIIDPNKSKKRYACNECREQGISCDDIFLSSDQLLHMLCRYFRGYDTAAPVITPAQLRAGLPDLREGRIYLFSENGAAVIYNQNTGEVEHPGRDAE